MRRIRWVISENKLFGDKDNSDMLKLTGFNTKVLFNLVETVTDNYSMRDLVEREYMHPAMADLSGEASVRPCAAASF
jgi:hypothetical protein